MFNNYLKIALRNLLRNKAYSAINIFGLALGVACCLLLTLYILDEVSYDKHHQRAGDLYRIVSQFHSDKGIDKLASASPPIAMALKDEIPEVEFAVRAVNPPGVAQSLIRYQDNLFYETEGYIADSTLFDVFSYGLKEGNPRQALTQGNSVVLSEKLAQKLFSQEPALDKTISINQGGTMRDYKVTGVFVELGKSHIKPNFFVSMTSAGWGEWIRTEGAGQWAGNNFIPSYLKLSPGSNVAEVEKKMNAVLLKYGGESMKALGMRKTLALEPVKDIYLKSDVGQSPRITYLYVVASIAVFILLIACINFMNLSTAKATKRASEIGIRKTMGAYRSSLIKQILGEAMLIVVFAIGVSIFVVLLALPYFNQLTDKTISLNSDNLIYILTASVILVIVTGVVAGSYPAFYLSSFQPAQVLKGKISLGHSAGMLRRALVVFQFMIAIALVCGIFVISRQLNFMQQKNLGFDYEAKIVLPLRTDEARNQYEVLKKEMGNNSSVKAASGTNYIPASHIFSDMAFYPDGGNMDQAVLIQRNTVDVGYLETMDMKVIAGRAFSENRNQDSRTKLILNRTAAKKLGFTPDKMVGQYLHFEWDKQRYDFEVIGVMEDFHQTSLHDEIKPILFYLADSTERFNFIVASVAASNFEQTVIQLEKIWKSQVANTPFEYNFLDENIKKQYDADKRISRIITSFGFMAMIICSLGLYGLSSYMAESRFKEIGIRKVMGASVSQIVAMMSTEFVKLVLIAFLIAVPVAWYGMSQWLESFAYRISVEWMVFAWAGFVALSIALITVSFESIKAAMGDPVKSLRNE
jgi:putative ABC transport system permease protein